MKRSQVAAMIVPFLVACGSTESTQPSASAAASGTAAASGASAKTSASAAPQPDASASATAPASAAAPAPPETLATMFDGAPDATVKMKESLTFGKASIGLPDGWSEGAKWDHVDTLRREDGAARVVLLRLDVTDAYADANIATWVKVPFTTDGIKWEPREPGKVGAAHLDAKVAQGTGKIGKDDAEFWQALLAHDGKAYGLIAIAGLKKDAPPAARAELVAAMRSIAWQ